MLDLYVLREQDEDKEWSSLLKNTSKVFLHVIKPKQEAIISTVRLLMY